ncbi:hypothetical protein MASR1M107_10110 [Ignavibacteriales bacterium]
MEHNNFYEKITLLLTGELNDTEVQELRSHMETCEECQKEYKIQQAFFSDIEETSPEFNVERILTDSRRSLRESIYEMEDSPTLINRIKHFFTSPFALPALTGTFGIVAGILVGVFFFARSHPAIDNLFTTVADGKEPQTRITNVRFNDTDTRDGNISFTFDAYKRVSISGSPDDPEIQKLLTYSILNEKNPGTRLNSINLVNDSYDKKEIAGVKEALIAAAKNDENPGVRLQALKTLASLPFDNEIKKTCLHVLDNDKVPGNRIEAINTLVKAIEAGFKADDEILSVFKNRLAQEDNPYIKIRAKTVLEGKEL